MNRPFHERYTELFRREDQGPPLPRVQKIVSNAVQQKRTDIESVRSKGRPRSRALRALRVRLRPARVILSEA